MTAKPPAITTGTTARLLSPTLGAENIPTISQEAMEWYRDLEGRLGKTYSGYIRPGDMHHAHVLDGTLHLMSRVLTTLPLQGTDGPPGERTYYAHAMDFGSSCELLRQAGCHLMPHSFRPAEIARILSDQRAWEIYKFEVRVPSPLLGFSFDGAGIEINEIAFNVYDGGNALVRSAGRFAEMAEIEMRLSPQPTFKIVLCYCRSDFHNDIDRYRIGDR